MSIHDNLNSPLLKRVKANEEALNELQEGAGNPTKIATGTDLYIEDSAALPLIDFKLTGKSVQNGTPTPDAPIAIRHSGDYLEMVQGYYNGETIASSTNAICCKKPIPCASGDIVKLVFAESLSATIRCLNNGAVIESQSLAGESVEFTTPSTTTHIVFYINKVVDGVKVTITPADIGAISLTINGKHMMQIVENEKNLLKVDAITTTTNGITFTVNDDGSVTATGTASADAYLRLAYAKLSIGEYILSGCAEGGGWATYRLYCDSITDLGKGAILSVTEEKETTVNILIKSGATVSNLAFYPMIRKADVEDPTFEPYKEKVTTILLDAPLRESDVMSSKEGVRNRASVVFDGSETWYIGNGYFYIKVENGAETRNVLSTHYKNDGSSSTTKYGNIWINNASQLIVVDNRFTSAGDFKDWLASNPITVEYELAEPIIETLDAASQAALNAIETFNPITHITVDSRIKPEISVEYVHEAYESIVNSLIDRIAADEWKPAGVAEGKTHLMLPEGWKELSIRIMSSPRNASLYIPRWMIESNATVKFYEISLMQKSERDVRLSIDKNEVYVWDVYNNGTELEDDNAIITNLRTFVYYK